MNNIKDVQVGDVFSETMYAVVTKINKDTIDFKHQGTGEIISLSFPYVEKLLSSADQYSSEVRCGIEDKLWTQKQIDDATKAGTLPKGVNVGDVRVPGIKTIWDGIGQAVFCVEFVKKPTPLSKKAYESAVQAKMNEVAEAIEKAQRSKKGVGNVAKEEVLKLINNPVLNYIPGEVRTMRAYKLQHTSTDGQYAVMDMDKGEKRSVNLPTVSMIVVNGVKYIKE